MVHVASKTLGRYYDGFLGVGNEYPETNELWSVLFDFTIEHLGVARLSPGQRDKKEQIEDYLLRSSDAEFLWFLGLLVPFIDVRVRRFQAHFHPRYEDDVLRPVDTALSDLNRYLEMNQLPYRIVEGALVDRDRELVAAQVEGPALRMLKGDRRFSAAGEELEEAIELLRSPDRADDAIRNASHALESALDVIANVLGWSVPTGRTLHGLLLAAKSNGLIGSREADTSANHFTRLVDGLVGGARNTEPGAGHGQGTGAQPDPAIAEFVVDVACAAIKLIYNAFRRSSA